MRKLFAIGLLILLSLSFVVAHGEEDFTQKRVSVFALIHVLE